MTGAEACRRDAVLTTSPEAIPWPASGWASSETSASPVVMPIRTSSLPVLSRPVADGKRGANGPLRIVLVRQRRPEERHHGVADELLDRSAVAFELGTQPLVVRAEDRLDVLRVERLGARGEADQVGEEHRHDLALAASRAHAVAASSASPSRMYRVAPTDR